MFGSEASGLSNNEISYANYTMQIPTNPDFKSLKSISQCYYYCSYVCKYYKFKSSNYSKSKKVTLASKKEIQAMTNLCIKNLKKKTFLNQ